MKYLTIKEAVLFTEKSESSIKRLIRELKKEPLAKDSNILKFERLKTGYDKIYIRQDYLEHIFFNTQLDDSQIEKSNTSSNDSNNSSLNNSINDSKEPLTELLKKTVDILEKELLEKNKQIESLLQRQFETNVILEQSSKKIQLLESIPRDLKKEEEPVEKEASSLTFWIMIIAVGTILLLIAYAVYMVYLSQNIN